MRTTMSAIASAVVVVACGGGGGGDGGSGTGQPYVLSFSPTALDVSARRGTSQSFEVDASVDRPIPEVVNVGIVDRNGVIEPSVVLTPLGPTRYRARLATSASLAVGNYHGVLEVRICRDSPITCASPVPGSPWQLGYDIHVADATVTTPSPALSPGPAPALTPAAPPPPPAYGATFSVASVSVNDYVGELPSVSLSAQLVPSGGAGPVYPRIIDPAGVFAPNPPTTVSGLSVGSTLFIGSATPGVYQGNLELRFCVDLPCTAEYAGSPALLPYNVRILAATNLTPLSPMSGVGEWAMHQADASHTGYLPMTLDASRFNRRWRWVPPGGGSSAASVDLSPAVTADGKVYVTSSGYFSNTSEVYALSENDKSVAWSYPFGAIFRLNPPAVAGGKLFVATSGHQDTYMWSFAASDGAQLSKEPFGSQWEHYMAPTIQGGAVYTNGGSYGGLLSFRTADGSMNWFNSSLPQYDQWTPAVDASYAYGLVSSALYVIDKSTGATVFSITDPDYQWNGYSVYAAPLLGAGGRALVVNGYPGGVNRLISFDIASRSIAWSKPGRFMLAPALANGVVYLANGTQLEARKEIDGSLLWSWTPPELTQTPFDGVSSNVVATDNMVFVSTASSVYAVSLDSRQAVWSYPRSGRLAVSPRGVLYIVTPPTSQQQASVIGVNLQ